jgi:outer membrane lipoprotein carrier protein
MREYSAPRRRLGNVLLAIMLGIASVNAMHAGSADPKAIAARLEKHYRETSSFSASFDEKVQVKGGRDRARSGTVYFHKPGQMRWEFAAPDEQLIVSDGTTIYSYDPELNQVTETPLKDVLAASGAAAFILGVSELTRAFVPARPLSDPADGHVHLRLIPKKGANSFEISLDPQTSNIAGLTIVDQLGNRTQISFSGVKSNPKLAPALFQFKVPDGADVVTAPAMP